MQEPYAIIGLGNPGARYVKNRHNVGFMCVDAFAKTHNLSWKPDSKREADLAQGNLKGRKIFAAKPQTYMNLSGNAVRKILAYYQIPVENLLVIYDDTAIPFGKIRFRPSGSAGSHNGIESVLVELGTEDVSRLRVGIGEPPPQWDLKDYVLANFTSDEDKQLVKIIDTCVDALSLWLAEGTEPAMNRYNAMAIV